MFQSNRYFKINTLYKNALVVLFILINGFTFSQNISTQEVRATLDKAQTDKESALQIYNTLAKNTSNDPRIEALKASSSAVMCLHVKNPAKKIKYAKEASQQINAVIANHSNILEARLIRFAIESKSPKVLGISKHIDEDRQYLLENFTQDNLVDIPKVSQKEYYNIFVESKKFSDEELTQFQTEIQ